MWVSRHLMSGLIAISIALAAVGCKSTSAPVETQAEPTSPAPAITPRPLSVEPKAYLDGVQLPVSLQFAPDGRLFFVEVNKGQVRVAQNGVLRDEPFASLDVAKGAEQGLVGLVLHPRFNENGWVYLYYAVPNKGGKIDFNRVVRMTEKNGVGTDIPHDRIIMVPLMKPGELEVDFDQATVTLEEATEQWVLAQYPPGSLVLETIEIVNLVEVPEVPVKGAE